MFRTIHNFPQSINKKIMHFNARLLTLTIMFMPIELKLNRQLYTKYYSSSIYEKKIKLKNRFIFKYILLLKILFIREIIIF